MKQSYIISGKPGAGKGTAGEYLREQLDAIIFRPSDLTRNILKAFEIPDTRQNLSKLMSLLRNEFTKDIYFYAAQDIIEKNRGKVIIFDGIRKLHLIKRIQGISPSTLIFIDTADALRYERIKKRGEKMGEEMMSFAEFVNDEHLESESENDEIRGTADRIIENNGTKEDFFNRMSAYLKSKE